MVIFEKKKSRGEVSRIQNYFIPLGTINFGENT